MNQELNKIHELLVSQHETLYDKLDTAPDDEAMQSILTEMKEIRHRIDLVQTLLFRETTQALATAVKKVSDADTELTDALSSAQSASEIVKGVSSFLKLVDQAIDLAKTLGAVMA